MKDDFLGECYLPPLGSLTAASKRYVLPVTNAAPEKGATRTLVWQIFFYPKNKQLEGSGLCIYIYIDAIHMMYDIFFSE